METPISSPVRSRTISSPRTPQRMHSTLKPVTSLKGNFTEKELLVLSHSWSQEVNPSDRFDTTGDFYRNISDALHSQNFWIRCADEVSLTNSTLTSMDSFTKFYSTTFADTISLSMNNLNDLTIVETALHVIRRYGDNELGLNFQVLIISIIATLIDSFADGFHRDLQLSWIKYMMVLNKITDPVNIELRKSVTSSDRSDCSSILSSPSTINSQSTAATSALSTPKTLTRKKTRSSQNRSVRGGATDALRPLGPLNPIEIIPYPPVKKPELKPVLKPVGQLQKAPVINGDLDLSGKVIEKNAFAKMLQMKRNFLLKRLEENKDPRWSSSVRRHC